MKLCHPQHFVVRGAVVQTVAAVLFACFAWLAAGVTPAHALKAIDVAQAGDRLDIGALGELTEGRGDTLQIATALGADGASGRMSVRATAPGSNPNWFAFALRNSTDKPIERWLIAERYSHAGSGIIWPDLDARRIENVTPSIGFVPERLPFDTTDAFRLTIEPGQTITFVAELAGDRLPRFQLWSGLDYEKRNRNRQLFHGIMLGVTGLLAIFLTAVFAANHKAIFPTAALFTWCVLAYLCVDFGFWHKLFNVRPEENAQYRAAGEAGMAATLWIFVHTFLRIGRWHAFIRMIAALVLMALVVLVGLAFLDPRLAATFARLSLAGVAVLGGLMMLSLALRGQDRALSLIPTWMLFGVWLFGMALVLSGRLTSDIVVNGVTAGLVLIVVLVGFTVTQFAFRAIEPLMNNTPDDQQLRSLAIDGSGATVFEWNAKRDEVRYGSLIDAALGLKPQERRESVERFIERLHPADRERLVQVLSGLKDRGSGDVRLDFRMRHVDNVYRWFELDATALPSDDRRLVRCIGLVRETTDQRRAVDRLMHDAVHDSLTGLPNRGLFLDRLATAVARGRAEPLVRPQVIHIDLDRFKSVNSSFGLVVGDSLLITVARRLARLIGPADTLARIGGDQFAMLFTGERDEREQRLLAEDVQAAIKGPITIAGHEVVLTASIGIAQFDRNGQSEPHDLMSDAETAMYRARRGGVDRIERFTTPMRADKDDRIAIESDLRLAIERKELTLLFQPIVYLRTEELAGFEALVRWQHPKLGLLNPSEFVPVAEESDLIVKLGSYVLQAAVTEAQRWQEELPRDENPLFVSVNVSSRQLFRPDLVAEVRHIMSRSLLPKGALRLEVTETLVMDNPEQATQVLTSLSTAGAKLALDDFGAGYSSLCYLNAFPVDTIKIDRALVQGAADAGASSAILRSIVALAHELGRSVVAEGVETEEQVGLLRTIGCENAQGYYYGEPKTARETLGLLRKVRKAERRLKRGGLLRLRSRRIDEDAPTQQAPVPASAAKGAPVRGKINGSAGPASARGDGLKAAARVVPRTKQNGAAAGTNGAGLPSSHVPQPLALESQPPPPPLSAPPPLVITPPPPVPPPMSAPVFAAAMSAEGDRSLARFKAELSRPARPARPLAPVPVSPPMQTGAVSDNNPTVPLTVSVTTPSGPPPDFSAHASLVQALGQQQRPQQPVQAPPMQPVVAAAPVRPASPNLAGLPPAIAESLARLAGGKPAEPKPEPLSPPPKAAE